MTATQLGVVHSVSSRPGTQREYETVMIMRSNANKAAILELVAKVQGIFATHGARLLKIENWGVRTLAFPVARNKTGLYLYWRFLGGSDIVREFERNLRITQSVIRFYTIRIDDDVDPDARPSEITEDLLESVSEPPPEEEEEPEPEETKKEVPAESSAEGEATPPAEAEAAAAPAEAATTTTEGKS